MRPIKPFIEPDWPAPGRVLALSTTRAGGDSGGPWRGFNLGQQVGDDGAAVAANRRQLADALPANTRVEWLQQVHGNRVIKAGHCAAPVRADGSFTTAPGVACTVLTADCLPVLLCDRQGTVVAAAHAGWRGLVGGVLEAAVAAMARDPGQLLAWLGPAIGPSAFEVGPEVREAFLGAARSRETAAIECCFDPGRARTGHFFADLYALARIRLAASGVTSVSGGEYCSYSDPRRFFSYRRDGQTGRMASLILLRH